MSYNSGIQIAWPGGVTSTPGRGTTTLRRPVMQVDTTPVVLSPQALAFFWSRVDRSGGPDACWLWTGMVGGNGYGRMYVVGRSTRQAHRIAWELANGQAVPGDLCACHSCDSRRCCNPTHLFLGTNADNSADMVRKGRAASGDRHVSRLQPERVPCGEANGSAKLTAADVAAIRSAYAAGGVSQPQLARRFGVNHSTIGRIVRGELWATESAVRAYRAAGGGA